MKKYTISLWILLLTWGCTFAKKEASPNLRIGTQAGYFPYESKNEQGELIGLDIDLAHALGEKLNQSVVFQEMDFDALILALKQGKIDLILSGMSITEKRLKEIAMVPYQSLPTKSLSLTFWQEPKETYSTWEALSASKKTVAVMAGTFLESILDQYHISKKPLEGNTDLIMELKFQKSEIVLFEDHIAEVLRKQFPNLQVQKIQLEEINWNPGLGIGIRKDNEGLISQITQAVESLRTEGALLQLETKWLTQGIL